MSWLSLLKAVPALLALISAIVGLIRASQARKHGRTEAVLAGVNAARVVVDKMAVIAASPLSDEEVERRLSDGTF
jgi:hypothetical protein